MWPRKSDIETRIKKRVEEIRQHPPPRVPFNVSWKWEEVERMTAYKLDMWSYDVICIRFDFREAENVVVTEEDPGFIDLTEQMSKALPIAPAGWYNEIMTPAFETCETILFQRQHPGEAAKSLWPI